MNPHAKTNPPRSLEPSRAHYEAAGEAAFATLYGFSASVVRAVGDTSFTVALTQNHVTLTAPACTVRSSFSSGEAGSEESRRFLLEVPPLSALLSGRLEGWIHRRASEVPLALRLAGLAAGAIYADDVVEVWPRVPALWDEARRQVASEVPRYAFESDSRAGDPVREDGSRAEGAFRLPFYHHFLWWRTIEELTEPRVWLSVTALARHLAVRHEASELDVLAIIADKMGAVAPAPEIRAAIREGAAPETLRDR